MIIKPILLLILTISGLNSMAQEAKPCLFIGRYDIGRKFMCNDQAWVREEIKDKQEYDLRRKQFCEEHINDNPSTDFVSTNQSVIIYGFRKNISGFACEPSAYGIKIGTTIEDCEQQLASSLAENPEKFKTQPTIVFTWQGKDVMRKENSKEELDKKVVIQKRQECTKPDKERIEAEKAVIKELELKKYNKDR